MECIDIESDTSIYKLALKESLYTAMKFHKVKILICEKYFTILNTVFSVCRLATMT